MNSVQAISLIVNGAYAIIAGNPIIRDGKPYTLVQALKDAWYEPIACTGYWQGETEQSYIVPHMHARQALHFARMFSQESVIADNALWYTDGRMIPLDCERAIVARGDTVDAHCDYTTLHCDDGNVSFHIPAAYGETSAARMASYRARMAAMEN